MVLLTNGSHGYSDIRDALQVALQDALAKSLSTTRGAPRIALRYCSDCGEAVSQSTDDPSLAAVEGVRKRKRVEGENNNDTQEDDSLSPSPLAGSLLPLGCGRIAGSSKHSFG